MFIPGRIEVLGKHTDYCGGRSIVCAIDRGFYSDVEPRTDSVVELWNLDTDEKASVDLAKFPEKRGHWIDYAVTVGKRLSANFTGRSLHGCTIKFRSDLPKAAGLSSSSALMIMVFAALDAVNDLRSTPEYLANIANDIDLAEYLGCVENGQSFRELAGSAGVGTFGGGQDHAAILLGKRDVLSTFAFSPLRHEADLAFPDDLTFVIASSGVIAEKTGKAREKYNRISRMATEITNTGGAAPLSKLIDYVGIDRMREIIFNGRFSFSRRQIQDRIEHFQEENYEIIPAVIDLMSNGRLHETGELIDRSQRNAESFLHNQTQETVYLQRSARSIGAIAASAFGAGFGGSVYAIVATSDAENFTSEWRAEYLKRFPQHASTSEFFTTRPSEIVLA
ncbi:MAG TPA: galactokinase family protein [Pyrinomonadaceae bacterium]|nr:galactokinase family protein [Pyrinomonadaceae bacterium]